MEKEQSHAKQVLVLAGSKDEFDEYTEKADKEKYYDFVQEPTRLYQAQSGQDLVLYGTWFDEFLDYEDMIYRKFSINRSN